MLHFRHVLVLAFVVSGCELDAPPPDASAAVDGAGTGRYDGGGTMGIPPIPIGYDAYRRWADWARLRIGARTYMRSTYDRSGGNEGADASHFLRRDAAGRSIALDIAGRGMVTFVRTNHWHGSPWHVVHDGLDEVVSESSTATPTMPVPGSVFLPAAQFPDPLAVTWSTTRGADLDWVPMPFSASLSIAYERTHYGTGYFMYQLLPDDDALTKPLPTWDPNATPPEDVLALLRSAGQDIAPAGNALSGSVTLPEGGSTTIATLDGPAQIRALSFFVPKAAAAAFGRATVKITWDGRSSPSVSAPVALLFGTGSLYNRSNVEYLVKSLPAVVQFRASDVRFALYFPMPYFSGAKIEIVAADAFSGARFEVRTEGLADPPAWLGYFHASYVDHGVPTSGSDLELLDTRHVEGVADWCGHLVGTSFVFSDRANLTTLEGDPRFFFDDSQTPQGQGTGTEEWAGGGDYWGGATDLPGFFGPSESLVDCPRLLI